MCLHTGAYLALSLKVRACVLIWFDSFGRFVFNVRLSCRKHNPLGVFKLFLGLGLQTSISERLISFMACLRRLFAKLALIWTRIELVGPWKALNRFSCSCILGLAEKFQNFRSSQLFFQFRDHSIETCRPWTGARPRLCLLKSSKLSRWSLIALRTIFRHFYGLLWLWGIILVKNTLNSGLMLWKLLK